MIDGILLAGGEQKYYEMGLSTVPLCPPQIPHRMALVETERMRRDVGEARIYVLELKSAVIRIGLVKQE